MSFPPDPLPPRLAEAVRIGGPANRSLVFDRGMDRWAMDDRGRLKAAKEEFFRTFAAGFHPWDDFDRFLERRGTALRKLGAELVPMWASTRLVVGLGLPHPTETGFLFDRMSGCPYLPGSSLKGLMLAAARLVGAGELEGEKEFWSLATINRVFGIALEKGMDQRRGEVIFYDSFPGHWPELDVDVLTPHYGAYYGDRTKPPADWENPVPVPFLVVEPGQEFRFAFGPGTTKTWETDCVQLKALLKTALDWLGIGAKKSAGYGYFGAARQEAASAAVPAAKETEWPNATLRWVDERPVVAWGNATASCSLEVLEPALQEELKSLAQEVGRAKIRGDVVVRPSGQTFQVVRVTAWKKKT